MDRARALGFDVDGQPMYHASDEIFEGTPNAYNYRADIENSERSQAKKDALLDDIRSGFKNTSGGTYFSADPSVEAIFGSSGNPYTYDASQFLLKRGLQLDANNIPKGKLTRVKSIVNGAVDKETRADYKNQFGDKMNPYQTFKDGDLYLDTNRDVQNGVVRALENEFDDNYGLDTLVFNDNLSQGSPHTSHVVFTPNQIRSPDAAFDPMKKNSANLLASLTAATIAAKEMKDKKKRRPSLADKIKGQ